VNIVGLGKAGCAVVDKFSDFPQYKTFKVDADLKEKGSLALKGQLSPEEYEQNTPSTKIKRFFKNITGETLFILCGAGYVAGAALKILEQVHKKGPVSILYIRPDTDLLSNTKKTQEKVVFNVLQEYTRSGVFQRMYIADNDALEGVVGDTPVSSYYDSINEAIVSTFNMIKVFENSDPEISTFSPLPQIARIATYGIVELDGEEKCFFPLKETAEKRYYYALKESSMEDGKLFKNIKKQIKEKNTEQTKATYGVFATSYEKDYAYYVSYTSKIQKSS
tara:strand:+ start:981 stop:1814 length:834 start_codon:yes stop_codon:yes gene_type:complete